ncbi:hypothetical protein AN640_06000 [Candidatus Epulonipiscium fishelsonii]|uniref:Uncharacterized protein n=1 Tax=Candidatus Epulonipiscium fishelsonii TaxID=77094 RepID=A0ACC8XHN2_9FIRM|nr:hypothetical protein AN640_06000 [Epulopiscium sp. SCG-D08WGA-EpuloA1]
MVEANLKEIELEIQSTHMKIEKAKNDIDYTLKLYNEHTEKYAISKYEPKIKAYKNVSLNDFNKDTLWIIMGYGFGYGIKKILDYRGAFRHKVIVIEPNEELLKYQMEFEPINEDEIIFFSGTDFTKLREILTIYNEKIILGEFCIITNKVYLYFYEEYFKYINDILKNNIMHARLMYGFAAIRTMEEIEHTILNYNFIKNSYFLSDLTKYKNVPAVIVSAGPSLSKNIDQLKDFNGLIFVVSRNINSIYERNIEADFIVHADSNDFTFNLLKENTCLDYPMICSNHSNYNLLEKYKGIKYFTTNGRKTCEGLGLEINKLTYAISVSVLAMSAAIHLKCNPIIFIGQDVAFTDDKFHDIGSRDEEEIKNFKIPKNFILTKAFDEKSEVKTSEMFLGIKENIEGHIKDNPDINFINATEGGAYIEGCTHMSLKNVIEKYNPESKIKIEHVKPFQSNVKVDLKDIIIEIEEVLSLVKSLLDLCNDINEAIKYKNIENIRIKYAKIEELLDQIDQYTVHHLVSILELSSRVQKRTEDAEEILNEKLKMVKNNDLEEIYSEYSRSIKNFKIDYELVQENLGKILELLKTEYRKG